MNNEWLEQIKNRLQNITPGPWFRVDAAGWIMAKNPYGKDDMHLADVQLCCVRGWGHLTGKGYGACAMTEDDAFAIQRANGDFMANARQDIPALLAHIEALETNHKKYVEWMRAWFDCDDVDSSVQFERANDLINKNIQLENKIIELENKLANKDNYDA